MHRTATPEVVTSDVTVHTSMAVYLVIQGHVFDVSSFLEAVILITTRFSSLSTMITDMGDIQGNS